MWNAITLSPLATIIAWYDELYSYLEAKIIAHKNVSCSDIVEFFSFAYDVLKSMIF